MDKKYFKVEVRASDPKVKVYLAAPSYIDGYGIVNSLVDHGVGVLLTSVEEGDDYVYHFGMKGEEIPLPLHADVLIIEGVLNVFYIKEV